VVDGTLCGIRWPGMMSGHRIVVTRLTQFMDVEMWHSGAVLNISQSVSQIFQTDIGIDARILLCVVLLGQSDLETSRPRRLMSPDERVGVLKAGSAVSAADEAAQAADVRKCRVSPRRLGTSRT